MLEGDYQTTFRQVICRLAVPHELEQVDEAFFGRSGPLPSLDGDQRRFPRVYYRNRIGLELRQSLPAVPRAPSLHPVYSLDVSRGGLSFLTHQQLFPGERVTLWLPTRKTTARVMRCVKRAPAYCVGVSFLPD